MSTKTQRDDAYVTNAELKQELDKLPTRWEMRALILAAVAANQLIPTAEVARSALGLLA